MSPSWALDFIDSTLAFLYLSFFTMWGIWEEWRRGKKVISPCQSPVHATPSETPDPCPNVWHLLAGPCCLLFCFHPPEGSPLLLAAQPLRREAKTWQLVRLWGMENGGGLALWCESSSVTQWVGGERGEMEAAFSWAPVIHRMSGRLSLIAPQVVMRIMLYPPIWQIGEQSYFKCLAWFNSFFFLIHKNRAYVCYLYSHPSPYKCGAWVHAEAVTDSQWKHSKNQPPPSASALSSSTMCGIQLFLWDGWKPAPSLILALSDTHSVSSKRQ